MTWENNETRHGLGARSRGSEEVADAKVAHGTDNTRQGRNRSDLNSRPETEPAAIIADYWHAAKARYKRGDYPDYGSPDWCALDLEDPRKMAGLVAFAQMWWKYGNEIATDLNRQLTYPEPLWQRATPEACDTAVRQIRAKHERSRKEAA
ncbi:hypothetical protein [Streptomyces fumanus]|uniref:hypothetical protein n=1 Tax=Streptomyces fumanus TaxID=67302 RepID=UPI0033CFFF7F